MYPFGDKQYEFLKWLSMVALPAAAAFVGSIGTAFAWEHVTIAVVVIAASSAFVGTLVGVSSAAYKVAHMTQDKDKLP